MRLSKEIFDINKDVVEFTSVGEVSIKSSTIILRLLNMAVEFPSNVLASLNEINKICINDLIEAHNNFQSISNPKLYESNDRPRKKPKLCNYLASPQKFITQTYNEGMNVYPELVKIPKMKEIGWESGLVALLYNLGQINSRQYKYDLSLRLFILAHDMYKHEGDIGILDEISIVHNISYMYYCQKKYDESLEKFREVYNLALRKFGFHNVHVASSLNCIGVVLLHMEGIKRKKIKRVLIDSLSIRKDILSYQNQDVATTLNNIGRFFFGSKKYEKAKIYFRRSLKVRRKIFGPNHIDVSATNFNVGQAYQKLGRFDEALSHYRESARVAAKFLGKNHQDIAIIFKNIGQIFHEKNQVQEAYRYYHLALKTTRTGQGQFNRETACILNLLGNLHYASGNFDEAIKVYEEGLSVERVVLQHNSINIVVTLSNIGQALMRKCCYESALCKYKEAYTIQCTFDSDDTAKKTETLLIIGQIASLLGRNAQAQNAFSEVVRTRRKEPDNRLSLSLALNYLGLVYFKQGDLDLAMDNFKECLCIHRECHSNDTGKIAVLLYNIASIYFRRGYNEMALEYYKDTLAIEKATLGNCHPDVAVTLELTGKVYERSGQFREAMQHYTEALEIYKAYSGDGETPAEKRKKCYRNSKLKIANLLSTIASLHLRQANTRQMMEVFAEAHRVFREVASPFDELKLKGFNLYALSTLHPECAPIA